MRASAWSSGRNRDRYGNLEEISASDREEEVLAVVLGGGGQTAVTIPGNPAELHHAAQTYAKAGNAMAQLAGRLRRSIGDVSDWQGAGAQAHATRAQALAAAHQVAADAFSYGAGALTTYAIELAAAQKLAQQANEAWATANATAMRLANVIGNEATASHQMRGGGRFAFPSPYALDVRQANQLQSMLTDQQASASNLANQAVTLADAADAKAARAFEHVTQMAGNPAYHGAADPFQAYLGTTARGQAAAVLQAGANLGGIPKGSDTRALGDLAADSGAGPANQRLARLYQKQNHDYRQVVAKDFTWLRDKGLKRPLPAKLASLSPGDKAALLSEEVLYIKHHQRSSGGLIFGLHLASVLFGLAAAGLTLASILQLGLDPATDAGAVITTDAAAAGGAGGDGIAASSAADAEAAADSDEIAPELAKALRTAKLNGLAVAFSGGALGTDLTTGAITGQWDVPQLVLDTAAFVPGVGAFTADLKVVAKTQEIATATDDLSEMTRGTDAYAQLSRQLADLKAGKMTTEMFAQLLAAKSFSIGDGSWVYAAASLGAPSS